VDSVWEMHALLVLSRKLTLVKNEQVVQELRDESERQSRYTARDVTRARHAFLRRIEQDFSDLLNFNDLRVSI
jgi:hypothetical protein